MENTFDYLKRRAYDELLAWKNDLSDKTALLIEGARRVGKTSLIHRFVEKEYESFIYIDFSEKGRTVRAYKNAFAQCENVADLLQRFQILSGVAKYPRRLGAKYVVCAEDLKIEEGITYLPLYMVHCIA